MEVMAEEAVLAGDYVDPNRASGQVEARAAQVDCCTCPYIDTNHNYDLHFPLSSIHCYLCADLHHKVTVARCQMMIPDTPWDQGTAIDYIRLKI